MDDIDYSDGPDYVKAVCSRLRKALVKFSNDETLENLGSTVLLSDVLGDSLKYFTFLMSLEDEFQIEIPDHKFTFEKMGTLDGIIEVLCECIRANQDSQTL